MSSSKKRKPKDQGVNVYRTRSNPTTQPSSSSSSREGKKARVVEVRATRTGRLGQSLRFECLEVSDIQFRADSNDSGYENSYDGGDAASLHQEQRDNAPEGKDDEEEEDAVTVKAKRQRVQALTEWLPYRQRFLDELIQLDGRGSNIPCVCEGCGSSNDGIYRCLDCFGSPMVCRECLLDAHRSNPFHSVEVWDTENYWRKTSLCVLGLIVTLSHPNQECIHPTSPVLMTVLHVNGLHAVNVSFCECGHDPSAHARYVQLMRARWFPATQTQPSSAFTMEVLELFQAVTVKGKLSAHDFYQAITTLKDNSGASETQNRYHEFLKASRCYRHLKMAKCAGRGHDPCGIEGTRPGELALECPSCPHPGKNIPSAWESVQESQKWLYGLYLALDANFRLKMKDRAIKGDFELGPGWAYFVNDARYKEELVKHTDLIENSSCESTHQAIARAMSRVNKGYSVTGVGSIICSRSGIVRGNGVADLQKGERYANMDYIFLSSLIGTLTMWLFISYDIACQWSRKLRDRICTYPPSMQLDLSRVKIHPGIPKFHISAHGASCQSKYSLNRRKYWARMDGEGIERGWANINPVAMSTREMGPGFRHDTLDDHWAAWNWYLIITLGYMLLKKLNEAVSYAAKQSAMLAAFSTSFTEVEIRTWPNEIAVWDNDPDNSPDPFSEPESAKTMKTVQAELDREELDDLVDDENLAGPDETMTATGFLCLGLQIEQQQCALAHTIKVSQSTARTLKSTVLSSKRTILYKRVRKLRRMQAVFMPRASIVGRSTVHENEKCERNRPEEITLILPSSLSDSERGQLPPRHRLISKECRLRIALGADLICTLRHLLRVRTTMYRDKKAIASGQRENTRANTTIAGFNDKIHRVAEQYRLNRVALVALDPNGEWLKYLMHLSHEDVQGPDGSTDEKPSHPKQADPRHRPSEGRKELSWIWLVNPSRAYALYGVQANDSQDVSEPNTLAMGITANSVPIEDTVSEADARATLKAEWCKTYVRAERWKEEVVLVCEEMRRTLTYCEWKANWWLARASCRADVTPALSDGLRVYAVKQATVWNNLGGSFARKWAPAMRKHGLPHQEWPQKYAYPLHVAVDEASCRANDSAAVPTSDSLFSSSTVGVQSPELGTSSTATLASFPGDVARATSVTASSTTPTVSNLPPSTPGSHRSIPAEALTPEHGDNAASANFDENEEPMEMDLDDIGLDDDGTLEDFDNDHDNS